MKYAQTKVVISQFWVKESIYLVYNTFPTEFAIFEKNRFFQDFTLYFPLFLPKLRRIRVFLTKILRGRKYSQICEFGGSKCNSALYGIFKSTQSPPTSILGSIRALPEEKKRGKICTFWTPADQK